MLMIQKFYTKSSPAKIFEDINDINRDLIQIFTWSKEYRLKINPNKTQVIIIDIRRINSVINWQKLSPISCDGSNLPYSDKVKILGIYIVHIPKLVKLVVNCLLQQDRCEGYVSFFPLTQKLSKHNPFFFLPLTMVILAIWILLKNKCTNLS